MSKVTFEENIIQWVEFQNKTFPKSTVSSKLHHLDEEVKELMEEVENGQESGRESVEMEFADCFALLFGAAYAYGLDLNSITDLMQKKLTINLNRKWGKPDENGVVKHLKDV